MMSKQLAKHIIRCRATFLLSLFSLLLLSGQQAFACSPPLPDPWFTTQLSFDSATLPAGIDVVQTHPVYEPYSLVNKSADPFYLVRESRWGQIFPNSELPENYEPLYKITSNQVYFWEQRNPQDAGAWQPNISGGTNDSAVTRVKVDDNIYILEGESRQVHQDNRPASVEIPGPQNFKILGFYRGALVEIRGTLRYSLNEKYDPQVFARGVKVCEEWSRSH